MYQKSTSGCARMLRDVSTWRRRYSASGAIGIPSWFGAKIDPNQRPSVAWLTTRAITANPTGSATSSPPTNTPTRRATIGRRHAEWKDELLHQRALADQLL